MDNLRTAERQYRPTLLDLPVSTFRRAFDTTPDGVTTHRRMLNTAYHRPPVEAIRAESDPDRQAELKRHLRAMAPVALLHHRKEDTNFSDKVKQQWPLLMGDVDQKDNPGVDMAELKVHLTRLRYVLLCAHSVRGGLWFVVRLPDHQTPDTLAAHFRYLQKLFGEKFGVVLDKGKGGNPTHLRFVSYDAAPYTNENPTVMSGRYTPPRPKPTPPRPVRPGDFRGPDAGELLHRLLRFTAGAGEGERHQRLLKAATLAGGYVATGQLDEQTAQYGLETVASEWPSFTKSQKTIRDGIRYGQSKPIPVDVAEAPRPRPVKRANPPPAAVVNPVPPRPNNTWLLDGELIYGEVLPDEPQPTADSPTRLIPTTRAAHPAPPLAFDAAQQLRAVRGCVLPPGETAPTDPPNSITGNPGNWPDLLPAPNQLPLPPVRGQQNYFDWQRNYPPFNQMGLASLQPPQQP